MTKKTKKILKSVLIGVLSVGLALGSAIGITSLVSKIAEDEFKTIIPSFKIGQLEDNTGDYVQNSKTAIYSDMFECQGLTITPEFTSNVEFRVFYFDNNENYISNTNLQTEKYQLGSSVAKYARGRERYAIEGKQKDVEWASKNMLVLGVIIVLGIGLHLCNFWAKMQLIELQHMLGADVCHNALENATNGVLIIKNTFASPIYVVLYLVWLAALWFHLTHGVWSALHTMGWNNNTWMSRVKCISNIVATLVVLMFAAVVVFYFSASFCCNAECCAEHAHTCVEAVAPVVADTVQAVIDTVAVVVE